MNPAEPAAARARALSELPTLAAQTVQMLHTPQAMFGLGLDEAKVVVGYMHAVAFPRGATLLREGDGRDTAEMLFLLEGEVSVDGGTLRPSGGVPIASLGPGNVLGEVALLDGQPRSAQCTALSPVRAAGLTRAALQRLLDEHPKVAAKLMIALVQRITERVRGMGQQLQMYGELTASLQAELDRLRGTGRR